MRTLDYPSDITNTAERQEVLRVWIDGGNLSISLSNALPNDYIENISDSWGMLVSDIFHHVVDAIVLETEQERVPVQEKLKACFEDVISSKRGSRFGNLKSYAKRVTDLPDPDVSGADDCVEIVRIVLLDESIRVMVLVGMWLPSNEESVWGNLLYDMSYMLASSINSEEVERTQDLINRAILRYIEEPSTDYTGQYYDTEQESGV